MKGSLRLCCEFGRMNRITPTQQCAKQLSAMRSARGRENF